MSPASDNQADPALLRPRRAFGLMIAVMSCRRTDHHGRPSPANGNREINLARGA